jgi:hypothetical protein
MVAPLPVSPSIAAEKDTRAESWIQKLSDPESVHTNTVYLPLNPWQLLAIKAEALDSLRPGPHYVTANY